MLIGDLEKISINYKFKRNIFNLKNNLKKILLKIKKIA